MTGTKETRQQRNVVKKPALPFERWGLWMLAPSEGEPRWLCRIHGTPGDEEGRCLVQPAEAEEQAAEDPHESGVGFGAVRITSTAEAQTLTT
jgi:hypothetical protein